MPASEREGTPGAAARVPDGRQEAERMPPRSATAASARGGWPPLAGQLHREGRRRAGQGSGGRGSGRGYLTREPQRRHHGGHLPAPRAPGPGLSAMSQPANRPGCPAPGARCGRLESCSPASCSRRFPPVPRPAPARKRAVPRGAGGSTGRQSTARPSTTRARQTRRAIAGEEPGNRESCRRFSLVSSFTTDHVVMPAGN